MTLFADAGRWTMPQPRSIRSRSWFDVLPKGRLLPDPLWRRRHRAITVLLWLHVPALTLLGLARGMGVHVLLDVVGLTAFALVAGSGRLSRSVRSIAGSTGLVTCSPLLVHIWDGTIEAHFHFFVVVSLLILYQDWVPFLIAIGYVLLHHGLLGALAPESVYAHAGAQAQPWLWALVHGGFVLAAAAANVASWRANEQLLRDPLTGLASRLLLHDRLRLGLDRTCKQRGAVAVVFIDLDRFKVLNDSLGHDTGDEVLRVVADRLRASTRGGDLAVRFGGDEFIVVCDNLDGPDAAMAFAERLAALLRAPILLDGRSHVLTVSIGVRVTSDPDHRPEDLVRDADTAMYRAKEHGKDRCVLFDAAMLTDVTRRLEVEAALREALARGEFRLHYQPELDLATGRVGAVEALLRWQHPERGLLAPAEFITVAEDTGLIVEIGAWVIREACRQATAWDDSPVTMRVNVSARQLRDPEFVDVVGGALERSGLPARELCLELTESMLMQDLEYSGGVLAKLRALGVQLALDDFGTGYSSLAYLRELQVDRLKIDRCFMAELATRPAEQTIVAAIVAMARTLELRVTAEGIETAQQLERVRALGCDAGQGFLLARPAAPEVVAALLHEPLGPDPTEPATAPAGVAA